MRIWIQKQKNGTFLVRIRDANGKNLPAINCGCDKNTARRILHEKKQEAINRKIGVDTPEKDASDTLKELVATIQSTRSFHYSNDMRLIVTHYLNASGISSIGEITRDSIESYRNSLTGKISPHTIKSRLRHIKVFTSWLKKKGYLQHNPLDGVAMPNPQTEPKYLSDKEIEALDEALPNPYRLAFRIAYTTGFRISNILSLAHESIQDGMFVVPRTKGKRPVSVPVHPLVKELLRPGRGPLFPDLNYRKIRVKLSKTAKSLEFRATWHMLRHTFTKKALQSGLSTFEVMKLTGHVSPQSMAPYAHFEMSKMKDRYSNIAFNMGDK